MRVAAFTIAFIISALIVVASAPAEASDCGSPSVAFAHCKKTERNYFSVLLAVHGWGGSCQTTFGSHNKSLFRVIGERKFFDFDCFDYNSFDDIRDNAKLLRKHLKTLSDFDYKDVFFVTHSMGGLIALQTYTDYFLDQRGNWLLGRDSADVVLSKHFKFAGLNAWAAPMEGLRPYIILGGRLARIPVLEDLARKLFSRENLTTDKLPQLEAGSKYLKDLKKRLAQVLTENVRSVPSPRRPNLGMRLRFFTGQGKDLVVLPLDEQKAKSEGWMKPPSASLTQTNEGHSSTVRVPISADFGLPLYPATITEMAALLALRLLPRFDAVFPTDSAAASETIKSRQLKIADAIELVAAERIDLAEKAFIEMLKRVILREKRGYLDVDKRVLEVIKNFILKNSSNPHGEPHERVVIFYCHMLRDVFKDYRPIAIGTPKDEQEMRFGKGYSEPEKLVLGVIESLLESISVYVGDDRERLAVLNEKCMRLEELRGKIFRPMLEFLESPHDEVRQFALNTVAKTLPKVSNESILRSNLVFSINEFYVKTYNKIGQSGKESVAAIFTNLALRSRNVAWQFMQH